MLSLVDDIFCFYDGRVPLAFYLFDKDIFCW